MNIKIQLMLFFIWLMVSPWIGAYLYVNVLPHDSVYGFAVFINVIVWVFTTGMTCAHFISILEEGLRE